MAGGSLQRPWGNCTVFCIGFIFSPGSLLLNIDTQGSTPFKNRYTTAWMFTLHYIMCSAQRLLKCILTADLLFFRVCIAVSECQLRCVCFIHGLRLLPLLRHMKAHTRFRDAVCTSYHFSKNGYCYFYSPSHANRRPEDIDHPSI